MEIFKKMEKDKSLEELNQLLESVMKKTEEPGTYTTINGKRFVNDRVIDELQELVEFAPPASFKQMLVDIYFNYVIELGYEAFPNHEETAAKMYHLIQFFHEMEQED